MGCRAWTISVVLVLLAAMFTGAGCAKPVVHDAKLPDDWPIPQLTLPNDIVLKVEPTAMHEIDPDRTDKEWIVGFDKDGNWPAFIAHVEGCLKPLDYWRSKVTSANNPLGLDLPDSRSYYSPDYLTIVEIADGAYFDALGPRNIEFVLHVTVYENVPPRFESFVHGHNNPQIGQKELEQIRDRTMEKIP